MMPVGNFDHVRRHARCQQPAVIVERLGLEDLRLVRAPRQPIAARAWRTISPSDTAGGAWPLRCAGFGGESAAAPCSLLGAPRSGCAFGSAADPHDTGRGGQRRLLSHAAGWPPGLGRLFPRAGHTVFTTDWPGQGRSGYIPSSKLSYEFAAEAMAELVRAIDDPRLMRKNGAFRRVLGSLLFLAGGALSLLRVLDSAEPRPSKGGAINHELIYDQCQTRCNEARDLDRGDAAT